MKETTIRDAEEYARLVRSSNRKKGNTHLIDRGNLRLEYSFAVPTRRAIREIAMSVQQKDSDPDYRIVEIGAGGGMWASLVQQELERLGRGEIEAYDIVTPGGAFKQVQRHNVRRGGPEKASRANALLLIWPPYEDPMAVRALRKFTGGIVLYVGEPKGGCTADDDFFRLLETNFSLRNLVNIPSWAHIHDNLYVYSRK